MKKFNYTKWLIESKHGKPLNEELDANKIKDLLKNLIDNSEVDSDVRSDLVGIILPSLEKANAPEELVKNLKILSNDFDTKDGVPYSRQPDEVKNAITYLTGDKAQKSVDQIGDVAGGYADALKPGTEKIYTATTFPDGLRDSDFYKKSVKDGWKFITKNSLTPDQEKIAKSLPTKSDGTPLKERIQELSLDQKAKLYFMGLVRQGKIDTLPEDPKAAYMNMLYKDLANVGKDKMDKDDYGRSVSGKDKRTFMEPEDSMPAARAKKMAGLKETSLEEGYNKIANKLYGVNYDKLSPQEQEYVRDTIDREPGGAFNPRSSKLAGMEDDPRMDPAIRSDFDDPMFENDKSKEDKLKMAYTAYDKAEMDGDIRGQELALAVIDLIKNTKLKEIATELGYLNEEEYYVTYNKGRGLGKGLIKSKESDYEEPRVFSKEEAEEYIKRAKSSGATPGQITAYWVSDRDMNRIDENEEVDITYSTPGDRFYKMKVDGKRLKREEGTKYLKGLGIDLEVPKKYETNKLDDIVKALKKKGIKADYNDAMDVS